MIVDGIMFNDELDILKLHLSVLDPVVDRFVIVEGLSTFSGKRKPYYNFFKWADEFKEWEKKIHFVPFVETASNNRWHNEWAQRNALFQGMGDIGPNDVVMISDADEIADPAIVEVYKHGKNYPLVFEAYTYYYYLNTIMDPQDITSTRSIVIGPRKYMTNPQEFRNLRLGIEPVRAGWHFSYLGGPQRIQKKLEEFSHAEYDLPYFKDRERLERVIRDGRDLFDRNMTYRRVEIKYPNHPQWLVDHLDLYDDYVFDPSKEAQK